MGEYFIKTRELKGVGIEMMETSKELKKYRQLLDMADRNLGGLGGSYQNVRVSINTISNELNDLINKNIEFKEALMEIIAYYEDCDKNICTQKFNVKTIFKIGNLDQNIVDPSSMSYEEYLEYRYKNATDKATKKLYKKFQDNADIKDDDYDETAHYNGFWNHIKYNLDDDSKNESIGNTYYHEVGHLVDDQSDWFGDTSY